MSIAGFKNTKLYAWNKKYFNTQPFMLAVKLFCAKLFRAKRTFKVGNAEYRYYQHAYNTTWRTERAVELPVVFDYLKQFQGKKILEVGNVSSHYLDISHTVVDKYESGNNVTNVDIVDFNTEDRFDLVITVSTLEHIGWDEEPREPEKVLRAVAKLQSLLAPGGVLVVTIPLGQNPVLDEYLKDGKVSFHSMYCLKRISKDNRWVQVEWQDIEGSRDRYPFRAANGLVIGIIRNSVSPVAET